MCWIDEETKMKKITDIHGNCTTPCDFCGGVLFHIGECDGYCDGCGNDIENCVCEGEQPDIEPDLATLENAFDI